MPTTRYGTIDRRREISGSVYLIQLTDEWDEPLLFVLGQGLPPGADIELFALGQLLGLLVHEPAAEVVRPKLPEPRIPAVDESRPSGILTVAQEERGTQV